MNLDITTLTEQKVLKVKNTVGGHETIADLRRQAKAENLKQRAKALLDPSYKPTFVRVVTFGRLGKNNPNAWIYKQRNGRSFRNGYQRIATQHAAELAVYINPMCMYYGRLSQAYKFNFVK